MTKDRAAEIVKPRNTLKDKVGGSGARIDMRMIERAEKAVEKLKTEFTVWIEADVSRLAACRTAFAATPNAQTRNALYRASFDLKGQAQTFEYPLVGRVAVSLCRLLDRPDNPPSALIDAHVDAIHVIVRDKLKTADNKVALLLATELEARVADLARVT